MEAKPANSSNSICEQRRQRPVELFKVTCVTCQAKLSVKNAALIGQIVACPRCESMVLVAPAEAAGPSSAQVEELLDEPVSDPVSSVGEPPPEAQVPQDNDITQVAAEAPVGVPMASKKAILWWIASFAIGASVTGALLTLRADSVIEPPVLGETVNTSTTAELSDVETQEESPSIESAEEIVEDDNLDRRSPGMISQDEPANELEGSQQATTSQVKPSTSEEPVEEKTVLPTEVSVEETASPKLVVEPAGEPRVARKFDPLRLDLEQMELANLGAAAHPNENSADVPLVAIEEEDNSLAEVLPQEKPTVVRLDNSSSSQAASRTAEIQLDSKVPSLTVNNMALVDYLDLVASLSGVPISVAPIELQMAGLSPTKQISVDLQETSLREVLSHVLKPLHLEAITAGPHVVVVREDADRIRKIDYPINDLIGSQTSAEDFARWIEELIAPESWSRAGGSWTISTTPTKLQIEQAQEVHFQILFFLERIRLAKKIPLRSRYPAQLLGEEPLNIIVADRVDAPTTFTFSHETPLAEVFRYWQSELGLPLFVDWPALAKENLWPDSRITCRIANQSWSTALDAVLTPLGLSWRASPGGTIQVTSQDVVNNEPMLDIYPIQLWQGEANDETVVIHDSENDLVYVRASAAAHRH